MLKEVKPVVTSLEEANVKSVVFCTVKYMKHYLVLCGPNGVATTWTTLKAAERSWKRNYTRLAQHVDPSALEKHFIFFQPRFHLVTDIEAFERQICPEPRRSVSAEYLVGNCLGLTCDNEAAEPFHASGVQPKINFKLINRLASVARS